jgi:hypothetical protein
LHGATPALPGSTSRLIAAGTMFTEDAFAELIEFCEGLLLLKGISRTALPGPDVGGPSPIRTDFRRSVLLPADSGGVTANSCRVPHVKALTTGFLPFDDLGPQVAIRRLIRLLAAPPSGPGIARVSGEAPCRAGGPSFVSSVNLHWVASAGEISSELWSLALPPPLEGLWWYRALEKGCLGDQYRFAYAVVVRGGRHVGIVPTFVMDVPIDLVAPPVLATVVRAAGRWVSSLRQQRTLFVGSPCSDEGTVGLVPGERLAELLPAIQDALEERARHLSARMIVWKDIPDEMKGDLERFAVARGLFSLVSFPGTRVSLLGTCFEDYASTLHRPKRHRLRRSLRRGKEALPLVASVVTHPGAAVLAEVFELFQQTYEHGKTKFERLTPEFFTAVAEESPSHFLLLHDARTGRLAAFMLVFLVARRVINKYIGMDYRLGREGRIYFQLWEEAVRWAYAAGATEIQSGQTGYPAKLDLGHALVPLTNYCKHRSRLVNRVFSGIASRVDWGTLDDDLLAVERTITGGNQKELREFSETRRRADTRCSIS